MAEPRFASRRLTVASVLAGAVMLAFASSALAGGLWRTAPGGMRGGGWWHAPTGGWQGGLAGWLARRQSRARAVLARPACACGQRVWCAKSISRRAELLCKPLCKSRTTKLPNGGTRTYDRTFTRSGYGDYSYDRSVTGPGGRTMSTDATQTFNRANGSYSRTVTTTGFNGKTSTSTTDFSRSSRGNYAYSYTDVGPNGKAYTRTIYETYNPANHDLTRTGSTALA